MDLIEKARLHRSVNGDERPIYIIGYESQTY